MVTYCTADDVARLLQTSPFSTSSTPTTTQVENIILRKEDRIDQKLQHGWREKTSNELYINPTFVDTQNGVRFDLPNYSIKSLSSVDGDSLQVWDGNDYVDFLANKTEGRADDYWLDYEKGVLFIRVDVQTSSKKAIKIKYRYGETTVPGEIEDLCVLLTAIDVLNMYERSVRFTDDGGTNTNSNRERIEVWKQEIKEIYNSLSPIGTF